MPSLTSSDVPVLTLGSITFCLALVDVPELNHDLPCLSSSDVLELTLTTSSLAEPLLIFHSAFILDMTGSSKASDAASDRDYLFSRDEVTLRVTLTIRRSIRP